MGATTRRGRREGAARSLLSTATAWIAAWVSLGGAHPLRADPGSGCLAIALVDNVDLPAATIAALEAEAGAILSPAGGAVSWRTREPGAELETGEVPVVLLAGDHPRRDDPGVVLGGVEPRSPIPGAWVYVRAVGRVIGLTRPPHAADLAAQRDLGVALGRVVAHELVHAIAPRRAHDANGLMGAAWNRGTLLGERPRLDAASAAAYGAGARRWLRSATTASDRRANWPSTHPEQAAIATRHLFICARDRDSR